MTIARVLPIALLAVVLITVGAAVAYSVAAASKVPDGPVDVVWDKAACAECGMHVGEPAFAAQLTTEDGRTQAFDDPGCLFLYVAQHRPDVHSMYFHDHESARWLGPEAVAFVTIEQTPMGFGFGAVAAGTPGAQPLGVVREKCLERLYGQGGK
jgi:hypothetical protein